MSITDGQPVKAATVNNAFVSKLADSIMTGILGLKNTGSGDEITNVQQVINDLLSRTLIIQTNEEDGVELVGISRFEVGNIRIVENLISQIAGTNINITPNPGQWVTMNGNVLNGGKFISTPTDSLITGENVTLVPSAKTMRLTDTGLVSINQIAQDGHGQEILVVNRTGNEVVFKHDHEDAAIFTKIITPDGNDIELPNNATCGFVYDLTSQCWTPVGGIGSGGSAEVVVRTITASETATEDDDVLLVDTSAGDVTVTLPATYNKRLTLKKLSDANTLIVSGTIDGALEHQVYNAYNSVSLIFNGSEWFTV